MAGLTEVFMIVFLVFATSAGVLVVVQRLTKRPLPVGCTPVNGECCRQPGSSGCAADTQRLEVEVEVRNAGT